MPKISIITTVFNAASTLPDCLESVRGQNSPKIEHILVDGASTDGTSNIIERYRSGLGKVISEPDNGIYDGMNKGIQLATGDIIGILNADDTYAGPDILSQVAKVFSEKHVDSCYGDLVYVDADDSSKVVRYWRAGDFDPSKFYWGWMPPHPTFFVRRSVYEKFGLFNLSLGSAADYEIMLRFLLRHKITTTYIPKVLVRMRAGGVSNASFRNRLKANRMDRKAWTINGLRPFPWTILAKPVRKIWQWFLKNPRDS